MLTKLFTQVISAAIRDGINLTNIKLTSGTTTTTNVTNTSYAFDFANVYTTILQNTKDAYSTGVALSFNTNTSSLGANNWICVGSGTTPPTVDDYKLENALLDLTYQGRLLNYQNNTLIFSGIVTNNTEAPVTINEVGVLLSSSSSSSSGSALIARTVLQEPVILAVGDSRTFSVAVNLDEMLETSTNG